MTAKRIAFLVFSAFLLVSATAKAEPSIPPSEECLSLTEAMLKEYDALEKSNRSVGKAKERALWKPLVDAGCLNQNPAKEIEATEGCSSYLGRATAYLATANAAMRPFAKQADSLMTASLKREGALERKIKRARKLGQNKRVRALKSKLKRAERDFQRSFRKLDNRAAPTVAQHRSPVLLVRSDLYTRGCKPTKSWFRKNTASFYAVSFSLGLVSGGDSRPPEESLSLNF